MAAPVITSAEATASQQLGGQEKVNILVVDDLPEKHVVFRSILEELGQNVISARSGKEALKFILEMEFAVILLDVNMPDIDGLETASLIRQYKKSAQTPIVFITAYVDERQAARSYELGAVDYIPSPVVPDVLRSKVRVFVELFRMNRQLQQQAAAREALARSEAAREAAEQAIERSDFLSRASQSLSRSLNLEDTIQALFPVAVPVLGDRATFVLATDGVLSRVEHYPPVEASAQEMPAGLRAALDTALETKVLERWEEGGRAFAVCPLLTNGKSRGALILEAPAAAMDSSRISLARDVVARASIALENARLYTAVQDADRRKNEFLAMLAHELRNPLAPIRNAVHIMQGDDVTQPTMNWARDVIGRQADHMARLIDDLLDVSRIVQGKVVVKPEKLTLASLVERSIEASSPRVTGRDQTLHVELPEEGVVLHGDAVRLAQVLSNLINNASKFSGPGTRIDLSARYAAGELKLSVKDQGAGIDAGFLPHIFDLFAQADQSLDRAQGGLGIGLTLVKHLVELHGGHVVAHSDGVGRGTEITVTLPAQLEDGADAPSSGPASRKAAAEAAKAPSRILVVDDLAASAETLMTLLEMEGYEVRVANEGMEALRIAEDFRPDVVLLDIGLPGMNGFEVAHRLRQQPESRDALMIALTGYGEAESRTRSAQAGFDFHMVKPADVNLLLSLLADPQQARQARAARAA
ncbi:hybrid sensor histidine kinase/response regulator [Caenimonas aquaedulcis]|uniref:histidine kinase n=1 Tax=Caenimonas aquaedulcis TaxID=2793270 RepID=A0A931H1T7_9BURK|nr:response regulator [Caenimonas aquaedulcis]MBG9386983.1 response regulator [Caenimonas aquaedulcis]